MLPWSIDFKGRLNEVTFKSKALKNNRLGDPHERPLWIYLPSGYGDEPDRRYPTIYEIQGLTKQIDMWRNRSAFRPNFLEELDQMFAHKETPEAIVVFVDCWTSIGGSQFIDSPGTGKYQTYLCDEVVPWVDKHYRTLASAEHRGIAGSSSGGFGAMVNAMMRPDLWGGFATHAGDALFECSFLPDFRDVVRSLRDEYHGSYLKFWQSFRSRPAFSKKSDFILLNTWAMAACLSADEDGKVRLPFDPATGQTIPEIWDRWLAWDPVRMVPDHADALQSMRAIYIDAGRSDEYYLDLGAEAFHRALIEIGVTNARFEYFEGGHSASFRYPISLSYLIENLGD